MSKACDVTHLSHAVDFCYNWKVDNFGRGLKIDKKIVSPPLAIPGTDGLVCRLVCTGNPGGFVSRYTTIEVNNVEKVVESTSLFSITLECEHGAEDVKLAGYVDVVCDDVLSRGSFGDQTKEQFTSFENIGNNKAGWRFMPANPIKIKLYPSGARMYNRIWHNSKPNQPLEIKLTLYTPGGMSQTSSMIPPTVMDKTSRLVANMKSLMLDVKHTDVVLKCKGEKFYCHKSILAKWSTVFSKLFDANIKEGTRDLVVIDDVEPDVVNTMVEFIYTGDVTKQVEDLAKVVYVADKYQLMGLLDFCFQKFATDGEDDQLVEMLILANKHSLDKFKDLAMRRIVMSKATFINDVNFLSMIEDYPQILFELFKA
eukprot:GFUD01017672.1.p1 GENE.GFUD01017672.1~~GFUD01017672.1.p1  ORF type:complete len:369 (-),score=103.24 GFUD01017672.1:56-1162(-)